MGRTACTEPQCLYKGTLYLTFIFPCRHKPSITELMTLFVRHLPVAIISSEAARKAKNRKANPAAAPVKLC